MQGFLWVKIYTIHNNSYYVLSIHIAKPKALENDKIFSNFAVAPETN